MDFQSAKIWSRQIVMDVLGEGSVAIDATMGNGNDTQWLCEAVGETGRVYAFDVQPQAVARTDERLSLAGLSQRARLFCLSHDRMRECVKESADAAVFNLGWLPGAEHMVTTKVETTLKAVASALELLKPGGVMTVCAYPGHGEGERERQAVIEWASTLDPKKFDAILKTYLNQPKKPPCMIAVQRRG